MALDYAAARAVTEADRIRLQGVWADYCRLFNLNIQDHDFKYDTSPGKYHKQNWIMFRTQRFTPESEQVKNSSWYFKKADELFTRAQYYQKRGHEAQEAEQRARQAKEHSKRAEWQSSYKKPNPERDKALKLLGLDSLATVEDIKKAYRLLARKAHPDTGGSQEAFLKLSNAYKFLLADTR